MEAVETAAVDVCPGDTIEIGGPRTLARSDFTVAHYGVLYQRCPRRYLGDTHIELCARILLFTDARGVRMDVPIRLGITRGDRDMLENDHVKLPFHTLLVRKGPTPADQRAYRCARAGLIGASAEVDGRMLNDREVPAVGCADDIDSGSSDDESQP